MIRCIIFFTMARKIVITSGKGGVGKTTITASLGLKLAQAGERVVAVDGDLGLNNLDVAMGAEGKVTYDLFDCMEDKCRVKQALVQSSMNKNFYLMPACFGRNKYRADAGEMRGVISELGRAFDYVLLDCPAGIDEGFRRAVACSEEALVVITPHVSAIRDADKVINLIAESKQNNVGLIVNKMRGDLAVEGKILLAEEIAEILKVELVGVIPEDDDITSGLSQSGGKSGKAFKILSNNVRLGKRKIYDYTSQYRGFFGSIRRKIKKYL